MRKEDKVLTSTLKSIVFYFLVAEYVVNYASELTINHLIFMLHQLLDKGTDGKRVVLISWIFEVTLFLFRVAHNRLANWTVVAERSQTSR